MAARSTLGHYYQAVRTTLGHYYQAARTSHIHIWHFSEQSSDVLPDQSIKQSGPSSPSSQSPPEHPHTYQSTSCWKVRHVTGLTKTTKDYHRLQYITTIIYHKLPKVTGIPKTITGNTNYYRLAYAYGKSLATQYYLIIPAYYILPRTTV